MIFINTPIIFWEYATSYCQTCRTIADCAATDGCSGTTDRSCTTCNSGFGRTSSGECEQCAPAGKYRDAATGECADCTTSINDCASLGPCGCVGR